MVTNIRTRCSGVSRGNKGFTLIEMAIVLIIIGIIIGAVVKGKDIIRGAEQKKIYTKFFSEWRIAYLNFYDRTGKILGDTNNDGQADGIACALLLSGGAGPPSYYGIVPVGLEPPTTNGTNACTYNYTDSGGNIRNLIVTFLYEGTAGTYNYMQILTIPNELAIAIDRIIDGEADGTAGDFLNATGTSDWGMTPTTTTTARWKMRF
ncbi:MAG: prepilin-type N-terminal cleavage/methylation domain-containing protein [Deltaproteobacteria bacterium]|nr:prepilin-type N-terminal cleavage/methylation domain-containing protein [Deltaproteobacteria bacterium]